MYFKIRKLLAIKIKKILKYNIRRTLKILEVDVKEF